MNNIFKDENIFETFDTIDRQKQIINNSVDFYNIFNVIYGLLEKLGVLNVEEKDPTKITFNFAYPDKSFTDETQNAVIFEIQERKRLAYETSAGKISQEKPRELVEYYDAVTGQVTRQYSWSYENIVTLDVFSTSCERMYQIIKYLETLFSKYDKYLQKYFTKTIYLGVFTRKVESHNLFKNRMFNKTISLKIVTESPFELLFEEIQDINQTKIDSRV